MNLVALLTAAVSLGALVGGAVVGLYAAGPSLGVPELTAISVSAEARPLDAGTLGRDRVGRLRFLGAVRLASDHKSFGGISALLWEPECQRLLAVTDAGNWLVLAPAEAGGRLTGVEAAWLAPLLDDAGEPATRKRLADAEALSRDPARGDTIVWFEGDHRGQRYSGVSACRPESLARAATEILRPEAIRSWPLNGGIEAAVHTPQGLFLFSEEAPDAPGRRQVVRIPGMPTSYPTAEDFVATDAVDAGAAGLLVLSRRFSPERGVAAMLFQATPMGQGFDFLELARFRSPLLVDNMEGLAVRQEAGRTIVYLASDNNFNPLQETLLMKFELLP
jgi:hypothetical protein